MKLSLFALLAFAISVAIIPIVIHFCNKYDIYDTTGGRKIHSGNIPRMGGIGFVVSFFLVSIIYVSISDISNFSRLVPLLISSLLIFSFGLLDDRIDLNAFFKLAIQIIATLIVVLNGFTFTRIGPIHLGAFGHVVTFFWILGVVNSFNLIDGMDGLCGGISFFVMLTAGVLFYKDSILISGLCFIGAGSILGFLVYNKPKAKIFMGDGGSQFLGFLVAVLPLYSTTTSFEYNKLPMAFLLAAIPIFDTFAAIWRRLRDHKSIFEGDQAHTHHKLLKMGYTPWGALLMFYCIQIFLSLTCIISANINSYSKGSIILICGVVGITLFFAIIHFTYRSMRRMLPEDTEEKAIIN